MPAIKPLPMHLCGKNDEEASKALTFFASDFCLYLLVCPSQVNMNDAMFSIEVHTLP